MGHSCWTQDRDSNFVFLRSFSQSFIQNHRTASTIVQCRGQSWMNIVANWLHKAKIELYNMKQIFRWDEFDWNATKLNGQMLKLVDQWQIWMKSDEIDFDIFAFQHSQDETEVKDKCEPKIFENKWKNLLVTCSTVLQLEPSLIVKECSVYILY